MARPLAADPQEEVEQRSRAAASAAARVATAAAEEEVQAARARAKKPKRSSEVMLGMVMSHEAGDFWGLLGLRDEGRRSDEDVEWAVAARREALATGRFGGDEGLMRSAERALVLVEDARAVLLDSEYRRVYDSMGSGDGYAEQGRRFQEWLETSARWQAEPLARLQLTWAAKYRWAAEQHARQLEEAARLGEGRRLEAAAADAELQGQGDRRDDQGHGLGTPAARQQRVVEQRVSEGRAVAGQQLGSGERSEEGKRKREDRGAAKKAAAKARKRELFGERERQGSDDE